MRFHILFFAEFSRGLLVEKKSEFEIEKRKGIDAESTFSVVTDVQTAGQTKIFVELAPYLNFNLYLRLWAKRRQKLKEQINGK